MLRGAPVNFPAGDYDTQPLPEGADPAEELRKAFQPKPCSSAFRGTSLRKAGASARGGGPRWEAYIKVSGKKVSLGMHASEEAAARAYDRAHLQLRGTAVNFPAEQYEPLPRVATQGPGALAGDALRAALMHRSPPPSFAAAAGASEAAGEDGEASPSKRARPSFRGVSLRKPTGGDGAQSWEAFCKLAGRKAALGLHASEAAAARAHDAALLVLGSAPVNFAAADYAADVASGRLAPRPDVTPEEIRSLAAPRPETHPTLLGVSRAGSAADARWRATLTVDGGPLRWGTGGDAAMAGFVYDVARVCLRGSPANAPADDARLAAVRRAPEGLRGQPLRAAVASAVRDAFDALGLAHAILEAPISAAAAAEEEPPDAHALVAAGEEDDLDVDELLLEAGDVDFD